MLVKTISYCDVLILKQPFSFFFFPPSFNFIIVISIIESGLRFLLEDITKHCPLQSAPFETCTKVPLVNNKCYFHAWRVYGIVCRLYFLFFFILFFGLSGWKLKTMPNQNGLRALKWNFDLRFIFWIPAILIVFFAKMLLYFNRNSLILIILLVEIVLKRFGRISSSLEVIWL